MSTSHRLPDETRHALNELRVRIRSYVFWEGVASVAVVVGLIFWSTFIFDWLYFRFSYLELPRWFRATLLIAGIGFIAAGAFTWLVLRTYRSIRTKSLALVLERRFPELDDRLITAVEAAEGLMDVDSPVTEAMLRRTVADVARTTKQLDLGTVFDSRPLRQVVTVAIALMASILGLAVVDSSAMERWVAGYIGLRDGYWPRKTELIVRVVVQPGDRLREFVDGHYRHPKGGDLTLSIEVPKGKKTPDRIRLDNRMGRGLTQVYLTPAADGQFRHTFVGLIEDSRIWISGGDFSHVQPYVIEVVPPPEVKQITLRSLYPEYTGMNRHEGDVVQRTPVELKGSHISLPMQTDFLMDVVVNKPMRRARIEGDAGLDRWEIEVAAEDSGVFSSKIILKPRDENPQVQLNLPTLPEAVNDIADRRSGFSIPFVMDVSGAAKLPQLLRDADTSGTPLAFPLPLPPDSLLRMSFEDTDDIASLVPVRFTINAIADQPPLVESKLRGIGTSITRKARVPIVGSITDDYGITTAHFEFRIDDAADWKVREFAMSPSGYPREFTLQRSEKESFERFDIQPLDLSIKQRVTLTITAIDGCTVPTATPAVQKVATGSEREAQAVVETAHRSQGLKFVFTIIPDEELLSMLYARELGLRRRVEQVISETKMVLKDLQTQQEKLSEWAGLKAANVSSEDDRVKTISQGMNATADRSLHAVRKNAVEVAGVESSFAEIREEVINNAVDTPAMLERIDDKILGPLKSINLKDFPDADGALGLFKLALDKNTDPKTSLETSIDQTTELIQNLERVLGEMAELARFDAVLEDLKKMIQSESELNETTKRKLKEKAIRALQ